MPERCIFQGAGEQEDGFFPVIDGVVVDRDGTEECILIDLLNASRAGILGLNLSRSGR